MLRQGPRRERFEDWAVGMKGKHRDQGAGGKKSGWVGPATVVSLDPDKQNVKWKFGGREAWRSYADSVPLPVDHAGMVDARTRGVRCVRDAAVQVDLDEGVAGGPLLSPGDLLPGSKSRGGGGERARRLLVKMVPVSQGCGRSSFAWSCTWTVGSRRACAIAPTPGDASGGGAWQRLWC